MVTKASTNLWKGDKHVQMLLMLLHVQEMSKKRSHICLKVRIRAQLHIKGQLWSFSTLLMLKIFFFKHKHEAVLSYVSLQNLQADHRSAVWNDKLVPREVTDSCFGLLDDLFRLNEKIGNLLSQDFEVIWILVQEFKDLH